MHLQPAGLAYHGDVRGSSWLLGVPLSRCNRLQTMPEHCLSGGLAHFLGSKTIATGRAQDTSEDKARRLGLSEVDFNMICILANWTGVDPGQ